MRFKLILTILSGCVFLNTSNCFSQNKKITIQQTETGGYNLLVDEKPFFIKGVIYSPTPIGEGYTYDFYSDPNKPWLVDGKLMQELGINCVRVYSANSDPDKVKEFIRDMYENFGIYTIISDWLGLWENSAPNYSDEKFQQKIKTDVLKIIETLKNEPGLLLWILGNENNYTFSGKIGFWTSPEIEKIENPFKKLNKKAEIYYSFVNSLAQEIKKIDPHHPIALGNGEASFLDIAANFCDNIDILAIIIYRGKSFGNLFSNIKRIFDKPVLLSEFGCDSYNAYTKNEAQETQAKFLLNQWKEIYNNSTAGENTKGNALGGIIFEWNDEWWKHNEGYASDWKIHNIEGGWAEGSYYFDNRAQDSLNMNEEWFGIVSLEEEINGINRRIPKQSFTALKDFFSKLNAPRKTIKKEYTSPSLLGL